MHFKSFDQRHYATVTPKRGYGEWAESYEASVPDLLDLSILEQVQSIQWSASSECLDLACGTGRIGEWLSQKGVATIDGLDLTPEMLERARAKNIYRKLVEGSVESTGLGDDKYDLLVMCLVDEHLESLSSVYMEAARVSRRGSSFAVVGMHPFFFMNGMPTHFDNKNGEPIAIETHIHLFSDHFRAARSAGWVLQESHEGVVDDRWIAEKPKWERYRNFPVNYGYIWVRS